MPSLACWIQAVLAPHSLLIATGSVGKAGGKKEGFGAAPWPADHNSLGFSSREWAGGVAGGAAVAPKYVAFGRRGAENALIVSSKWIPSRGFHLLTVYTCREHPVHGAHRALLALRPAGSQASNALAVVVSSPFLGHPGLHLVDSHGLYRFFQVPGPAGALARGRWELQQEH